MKSFDLRVLKSVAKIMQDYELNHVKFGEIELHKDKYPNKQVADQPKNTKALTEKEQDDEVLFWSSKS